MSWIYLVIAGLLEVCWAMGMKYSDGFTRFWPSVFTVGTLLLSFVLLTIAVKNLPVGTAYAVWTGIGILGTTVLGMILLGESRNAGRVICLGLIFIGIMGLKLINGGQN